MGTFSIWHWLIVLAVVLVLFGGGGKLSSMMGDLGKGIRSLKANLKGEEDGEGEGDGDAPMRQVGAKNASKKPATAKKKAPAKKRSGKS